MAEAARETKPTSRTFYRIRVTILLLILAGVILYAWYDHHKRAARNDWNRTLHVAFVVVREGPVSKEAVKALEARVPALELRLTEEMQRYKPNGPVPPIEVAIFGPVDGVGAPPVTPSESGIVASVRYQYDLDRWVSKVDDAGVPSSDFDSRIYLYARPPASSEHKQIEGASELGGTIGVVRVELDESMADFTLFVASHELFHTLGATDKYAPDGSILVPDGLAEPSLEPLYPQRYVELMARHRPLGGGKTKPPASLDELAVGAKTAQEIGWLPK